MIVHRLKMGYVKQVFDTDEQEFVEQEFVHTETEYENDKGEGIYDVDPDFKEDDIPELETTVMQPNDIGMERFEWFDVFQILPDGGYFVCIPEEEPTEEWEGFKTEKEAQDHMEDLMKESDAEYAVVKESRTVVTKGYGYLENQE